MPVFGCLIMVSSTRSCAVVIDAVAVEDPTQSADTPPPPCRRICWSDYVTPGGHARWDVDRVRHELRANIARRHDPK
jgi:hypothetical protein